MHVGSLREFGGITPCHADQRDAEALDQGQEREDLVRTAAVRQGENDICLGDHPHVSMGRLSWVNKKCWSPRAGQRRGYFTSDVAGFSHACDNHSPCYPQNAFTGGNHLIINSI